MKKLLTHVMRQMTSFEQQLQAWDECMMELEIKVRELGVKNRELEDRSLSTWSAHLKATWSIPHWHITPLELSSP